MRLISTETLEMEEFVGRMPPYAILSHRWLGEELSYEKYCDPALRNGPGYEKIVQFCRHVRSARYQTFHGKPVNHIWVDTVCIDKRSSAELSEAVNSMWQWYWDSCVCVAYLHDVGNGLGTIEESELFRRGWTLQELLAPERIVFCDKLWKYLGRKGQSSRSIFRTGSSDDLSRVLSVATGIPQLYLRDRGRIFEASLARRMSWASRRVTTRTEDMAYCLMGLFQINMPLLYGEGNRAFRRLQEEILKISDDESIFAWTERDLRPFTGVLARDPRCFRKSGGFHRWDFVSRDPINMTNKGLQIRTTLEQIQHNVFLLKLNCAETRGEHRDLHIFCNDHPDFWRNNVLNNSEALHGCQIALYRSHSGNFSRFHMDLAINPVRYNKVLFQKRTILESLLYINEGFESSYQTAQDSCNHSGTEYESFGDADALWDRDSMDCWYDVIKSQQQHPVAFRLVKPERAVDGDKSVIIHSKPFEVQT